MERTPSDVSGGRPGGRKEAVHPVGSDEGAPTPDWVRRTGARSDRYETSGAVYDPDAGQPEPSEAYLRISAVEGETCAGSDGCGAMCLDKAGSSSRANSVD